MRRTGGKGRPVRSVPVTVVLVAALVVTTMAVVGGAAGAGAAVVRDAGTAAGLRGVAVASPQAAGDAPTTVPATWTEANGSGGTDADTGCGNWFVTTPPAGTSSATVVLSGGGGGGGGYIAGSQPQGGSGAEVDTTLAVSPSTGPLAVEVGCGGGSSYPQRQEASPGAAGYATGGQGPPTAISEPPSSSESPGGGGGGASGLCVAAGSGSGTSCGTPLVVGGGGGGSGGEHDCFGSVSAGNGGSGAGGSSESGGGFRVTSGGMGNTGNDGHGGYGGFTGGGGGGSGVNGSDGVDGADTPWSSTGGDGAAAVANSGFSTGNGGGGGGGYTGGGGGGADDCEFTSAAGGGGGGGSSAVDTSLVVGTPTVQAGAQGGEGSNSAVGQINELACPAQGGQSYPSGCPGYVRVTWTVTSSATTLPATWIEANGSGGTNPGTECGNWFVTTPPPDTLSATVTLSGGGGGGGGYSLGGQPLGGSGAEVDATANVTQATGPVAVEVGCGGASNYPFDAQPSAGGAGYATGGQSPSSVSESPGGGGGGASGLCVAAGSGPGTSCGTPLVVAGGGGGSGGENNCKGNVSAGNGGSGAGALSEPEGSAVVTNGGMGQAGYSGWDTGGGGGQGTTGGAAGSSTEGYTGAEGWNTPWSSTGGAASPVTSHDNNANGGGGGGGYTGGGGGGGDYCEIGSPDAGGGGGGGSSAVATTLVGGTPTVQAGAAGGEGSNQWSAIGKGSINAVSCPAQGTSYPSGCPGYVTLTWTVAPTSTAVTSSANPSSYGQPVTLTATVAAGGGGAPTGTVSFLDGTATIGTASLAVVGGNDQAALTVSSLPEGTDSITAVYGGDANYPGSTSAVLVQLVNRPASATTLASSTNPSNFGDPVTFTATVSGLSGSPPPTGTVTFHEFGTVTLGSATLAVVGGNDQATLTVSSLPGGPDSITAVYGGDGTYAGSTSAVLVQVVKRPPDTPTLSSSLNPSLLGQPVTFTATVPTMSGSPTPTGSVFFDDGSTTIGTASLAVVAGNGQATLTVSSLAVGSHQITAIYIGDGTYPGGYSAPLDQQVNAGRHSVVVTQARFSGPGTASSDPTDSYVDLTNTTTVPISLAGWTLNAASAGGGTPTTIDLPAAVTLSPGQSLLVTGSDYSLDAAPTVVAAADEADALPPDTLGVQVDSPAGAPVDAVGYATAPAGYQGADGGLTPLGATGTAQYAFVRHGSQAAPVDSDNNANDFSLVSTTGATVGGVPSIVGSPSPLSTTSPRQVNAWAPSTLLDPSVAASQSPNRIYTPGDPGTLVVNRTITNNTSTTITNLVLRITDLTEQGGPPAGGHAWLRVVASTANNGAVALSPNTPVGANGGGLGTTLSPTTPITVAPGGSISVAFQFAVDQGGPFSFGYDVDAS